MATLFAHLSRTGRLPVLPPARRTVVSTGRSQVHIGASVTAFLDRGRFEVLDVLA